MTTTVHFIISKHPCEAFLARDAGLAAEVEAMNTFNSLFVKNHFNQGDRIAVEANAEFTGKQLTARLLPELGDEVSYTVQGIDLPAAVEMAKSLRTIETLYLQAVVRQHYTSKKILDQLHAFAQKHLDPQLPPPNPTMREALLDYVLDCLERAQSAYVEETWDMRQNYMVTRLDDLCSQPGNVFVVLGKRHLEGLLPFPYPYEIVEYTPPVEPITPPTNASKTSSCTLV